ncbi:MAG: PRC-barrel domain-containing protein [Gammaproteobacteria bacterium]|jgi:hypothetical protein
MRQLRKLADLKGYRLQASDGEIGKLKQVFFDDRYWKVRYLVVHTGNWLLGREVLVVPSVIAAVDEVERHLEVNMTREQIRECPPVSSEQPVSRHYEREYYRYYGWDPYWEGDPLFGPMPDLSPPPADMEPEEPENPHLRSSNEVTGYAIHAADNEFGQVKDFLLDDQGWSVRYLEIDTRNWLPGRKVLIAPAWIRKIDWHNSEVEVNMASDVIQTAPAYDETRVVSREYEVELYKHYGMEFDQQ